jgi:hypothetical protein
MLAPALQSGTSPVRSLPGVLIPSLSDCLFLAILLWVFAAGAGWSVLLADGDAGWHIRTGDYILATRSVPVTDLFSFSKAGQPWFAWEWLSDVIFSALHRAWGLKGLVAAAGLLLSFTVTLLFRHMMWRGANLLIALVVTLVAAGASTVHFLARPHIFTFLGLAAALWILERDRRRHTRAVWWLVPMTALWTNLHGGFLAWIASLALIAAGCVWKEALDAKGIPNRFGDSRRYGLLTAACSLATLLNPYGWRLHQHIAQYLTSDWIRQVVDEFQSPRFRSESMLQFELLLFAGLTLMPVLVRQHRFPDLLLVLFWGHSALVSARHVPLYAIVAAPLCAVEASRLWAVWSEPFSHRSIVGTLRDCLRDFSAGRQHTSVWVGISLFLLAGVHWAWPQDFPGNKFPVVAFNRNASVLAGSPGAPARILTSDQWGDYLIYRQYPRQRVFIDGRSDFYGPEVGRKYLDLLNAQPDWEDIVQQYRFDLALLPIEWPLGQVLMRHPDWRVRYQDRQAILLERYGRLDLNKKPHSTERIHGEQSE